LIYKDRLKSEAFGTVDEFLSRISDVLGIIGNRTLEGILQAWMQRLQACIQANGEHAGEAKIQMRE
jgi:hypothetical protein